jgi:hypothetical protein
VYPGDEATKGLGLRQLRTSFPSQPYHSQLRPHGHKLKPQMQLEGVRMQAGVDSVRMSKAVLRCINVQEMDDSMG